MMRTLILAVVVLAAFVPFVPAIVFAATLTFAIFVASRTLRREKTRCDTQPVALLALSLFRALPAFA
jgi:hypothetical protein